MFSAATLDKLEQLNNARTPGPWVSRKHLIHDHSRWGDLYEIHARDFYASQAGGADRGKNYVVFGEDEEGVGDDPIMQHCDNGNEEADAEFVAASANAMRELIRLARIGLAHSSNTPPSPGASDE